MVQLRIVVRPTTAYNAPNKTRSIVVDTFQRVEDVVNLLKLEKKGTHFYSISRGASSRELPMNSSLASHNIQDGQVIESCACPALSAVLSAVLRDLDAVDQLEDDQRDEAHIRPLLDLDLDLDLDTHDNDESQLLLDPWPTRWSREELKTRKICLATYKKVIQRGERFEDTQVPSGLGHDLAALCAFMKPVLERESLSSSSNRTANRSHNSLLHVIKPTSKNGNGKPTTCWTLLQNKLDKLRRIGETIGPTQDAIEEFVKQDYARHHGSAITTGTPRSASRRTRVNGNTPTSNTTWTPQRRVRRKLHLPASTPSSAAGTPTSGVGCSTCNAPSNSICLQEACPFWKLFSCAACFRGNHPLLQRDHERVALTDARVRPILRMETRGPYVPEYASGAYAILSTLVEAADNEKQREFSLDESRLKTLAQQRCRSNLYDRQARGRNAFSCVENLSDKELIRKELIPGPASQEAKFSLLAPGEALGRCCLAFEKALNSTLTTREMTQARQESLHGGRTTASTASTAGEGVRLIIDTREDSTYAERLAGRCRDKSVDYDRRDLPAGDYLYTFEVDGKEMVLPVVIERKSWSDLADSVTGRGHRRLDCVRLDGNGGSTCRGNCQLCRMKKSGCSTILFLIEGARCLNRDHEEKCTDSMRCKYCRELVERHGSKVVHEELEKVLFKLQAEHGCFIHFTRGYNETISSLLMIRSILGSRFDVQGQTRTVARGALKNLSTYQQFCTNARRSTGPTTADATNGEIVKWTADEFISEINTGKVRRLLLQANKNTGTPKDPKDDTIIIDDEPRKLAPKNSMSRETVCLLDVDDDDEESSTNSLYDLNDSQESILVLDNAGWTKPQKKRPRQVATSGTHLHEGSEDDEIELVGVTPAKKVRTETSDHEVVVLEGAASTATTRMKVQEGSASSQKIGRAGCEDTTSRPLLVVRGMYEYDREYHEDLNKVWKALYKANSTSSLQNFERRVTQQICALKAQTETDLPMVPRESVLFWGLYIQLHEGIRLHFTRRSTDARRLEQAWLGNHSIEQNTTPRPHQNKVARLRQNSPARRSLDFGEAASVCLICNKIPGANEGITTQCDHLFHRVCLSTWAQSTNTRKCPHCKTPGIGIPKDDQPVRNQIHPPRVQGRPPRPPVPIERQTPSQSKPGKTSDAKAIREARLRRFGENSLVASASAPASWSCSQCTLHNELSSSKCSACGTPKHRPTNSTWKCDRCTLENPVEVTSCTVCDCPKPFLESGDSDQFQGISASAVASSYCEPVLSTTNSPDTKQRSDSATKKVTCGACRQRGHNRASATRASCPAYNDPDEIDRREMKILEAARIAREKREDASRFARLNQERLDAQTATTRELQRVLAEQERLRADLEQMTDAEARRKQKDADRAEKRARKLAG